MKSATFIVPGYIGNQRIEATRRRRRRRLVDAFWLGAALAIAAAGLCAFQGCGVEKEEDMRTKIEDVGVFQLQSTLAAIGTVHTFRYDLRVPDPRVRWSIRSFLLPAEDQKKIASAVPLPTGNYFAFSTPVPTDERLYWDIAPVAPVDLAGGGAAAQYDTIRHHVLPDAWEEDGSSAERLSVVVTYKETDWDHWFPSAPSALFQLVTLVLRATFSPGPGACFAKGEWEDILSRAALIGDRVMPVYGSQR